MKTKINVLDKGFVKLLNLAGPTRRIFSDEFNKEQDIDFQDTVCGSDFVFFDASDRDPAQVARISFDNFREERTEEQDYRLYEYLIKHKHSSPIEFIQTYWEMKLPIFVERQFVRHRTQSINEVSARYSILPDDWYIPDVVGGKSKNNKQGQENSLREELQALFKSELNEDCENSYNKYSWFLNQGVAPEHARMFLHLNHYTHLVRTMNLHNCMHFLSLRLDSHAQIEARAYAQAMFDLLNTFLPKSMELFKKYRMLEV